MVKKIFIALLLAHAFTNAWVLFPTTEHHFPGYVPGHLNEQWFWKGFADCVLRATYAGAIVLLVREYNRPMAWFFYIAFCYYALNLFLYWYNYCQWKTPFYMMYCGLVVAAAVLWPKSGMRVVK